MRFIEFMPLDADGQWRHDQVLCGAAIRAMLEAEFGPLVATARDDPSQPAVDFAFADGNGRIGFINPITQPFCGSCNRLRLTAEGKIRNCLFSTTEWDARAILRDDQLDPSAAEDALTDLVRSSVLAKKSGHGIDTAEFVPSKRAMYQIGG
jgi:cyclic pyranopterin phosphate synthase